MTFITEEVTPLETVTFSSAGKRNNISDLYINWPTGGALCPKLCFVYISNPTDDPKWGKHIKLQTFNQVPSSGEILN